MASLITDDRIRDTTTTTASPFTVSGTAPTTYKTFNQVCSVGDVFMCAVVHPTLDQWQVGFANYSASNQVTFTSIYNSSNADAAVTFSAGTMDVYIVWAGMAPITSTLDRLPMWDASAGTWKWADLASLTTEAAPAAGDYLLIQRDTDDIAKINWGLVAPLPGTYVNATLVESHAASAATFNLKTVAGIDPSSTDPVTMAFNNGTVTRITSALSITIPSTATMRFRNAIPARLWFCLINDGGTPRLGVRNCVTTVAGAGQGSSVTLLSPFSDHGTLSSTTIGTGSDNAGVTYTDTAVSADPFVVLGYADYDSLTTAGTWATSPDRIVMYGDGIALPGQTIQYVRSTISTTPSTGTTTVPNDGTIPQITEGNLFTGNSVSVTANSTQNVLRAEHIGEYTNSVGDTEIFCGLFQSVGGNNCLAENKAYTGSTASQHVNLSLQHMFLAASLTTTTFSIRVGSAGAATITMNSAASSHGNVYGSHFTIEEIMG